MNRRIKIAFLMIAALSFGAGGVYEAITPPPDQPEVSEDVAAVIGYMNDVDAWKLDAGARWALHPKTGIAVYASRFSDIAEIRIGVSDVERTYSGIAVPLGGADGYAFGQASITLDQVAAELHKSRRWLQNWLAGDD